MNIEHRASTWCERLALISCCIFVLGLIRLTLWKENELFWMNAGGYPIWLRDSVRFLYYPYLFFTAAALCIVTRSILGRFVRQLDYHRAWALLLAAWILFFSNFGILVANNLDNLWKNKPLHHHDPIESTRPMSDA